MEATGLSWWRFCWCGSRKVPESEVARIRSTEERWGVGGLPSELSHQNYYGGSIDPFYISIVAAGLIQHAISCHMKRKCDNSPYVAKPFKHLVEEKRWEEWLLGDLLHVADKHMHVLCYRGKWEQESYSWQRTNVSKRSWNHKNAFCPGARFC